MLARRVDMSVLLTEVIKDVLSAAFRGLPFNRLVYVEHLPADLPGRAEL